MVYLIILAKKLNQMMIMFETTTILANLPMKLAVTAGLFIIDTRTPMTITVTEEPYRDVNVIYSSHANR